MFRSWQDTSKGGFPRRPRVAWREMIPLYAAFGIDTLRLTAAKNHLLHHKRRTGLNKLGESLNIAASSGVVEVSFDTNTKIRKSMDGWPSGDY